MLDLQVWPEPCKHPFQLTGNGNIIAFSPLYLKMVYHYPVAISLLNNPSLKTGELERRVDLEQDELLIKLGLVHIQGECCGQVHIVFFLVCSRVLHSTPWLFRPQSTNRVATAAF